MPTPHTYAALTIVKCKNGELECTLSVNYRFHQYTCTVLLKFRPVFVTCILYNHDHSTLKAYG